MGAFSSAATAASTLSTGATAASAGSSGLAAFSAGTGGSLLTASAGTITGGSVASTLGPLSTIASPSAIGFGSLAATPSSFSSFLSQAGTGLKVANTAFNIGSGISKFMATRSAADASLRAAQARGFDLEVQIQRQKTQRAIEEAERERRLRRVLAAQRATFAGGGADIFQGSPATIQEQTVGEINREQRLADFTSGDIINQINRERTGVLAEGAASATALRSKAFTGLAETGGSVARQGVSLLDDFDRFKKTRK